MKTLDQLMMWLPIIALASEIVSLFLLVIAVKNKDKYLLIFSLVSIVIPIISILVYGINSFFSIYKVKKS